MLSNWKSCNKEGHCKEGHGQQFLNLFHKLSINQTRKINIWLFTYCCVTPREFPDIQIMHPLCYEFHPSSFDEQLKILERAVNRFNMKHASIAYEEFGDLGSSAIRPTS